jgi:N-methylhydantoinase A/oxoprolinase/acetone carboxylase beta subunit
MPAGLHNNPERLRKKLQAAIDKISATGLYTRIIIGYGICGKGTVSLRARNIPLVLPKVHDCVSLFLGGDDAYKKEFKKYPGTYYLSAGWCEADTEIMSENSHWAWFGDQKLEFDEIARKHGQKAARQTFDFLNSWQKNYQRAAFIDTGIRKNSLHEKSARKMAEQFNWEYHKIKGNSRLIVELLTCKHSNDDILFVPEGHVTGFDAVHSSLCTGAPVTEPAGIHHVETGKTQAGSGENHIKTGLGVDAGGTYTDAVIHDFEKDIICSKAKALTTRWDYTKGIANALQKLDNKRLEQVELVSLSTTLATNAIVEGEGQTVGMILMPPPGSGAEHGIDHNPKAVVAGQMDISGRQVQPPDPDEIKTVADTMINTCGVNAFAVSGYAGSINPEHELRVKDILTHHTGLFVSCGHELSDTLNFQTRAVTAMLNARIIPRLTHLLDDLEKVLARQGIKAPVVVVKGDGTLMSAAMAKKRPVETILSGPAASVAGARHLTGLNDALVVDMGGTTTDTAALSRGNVSLNMQGSNVGGHRTHVKALEIRTAGLGGDSLIELEKGTFTIGPARVGPVSWLGRSNSGIKKAIKYLENDISRYSGSSEKMHIIALTGSRQNIGELSASESRIISLLESRPMSIDELSEKMQTLTHTSLPLKRLEENCLVQRCGLTMTDLLHITGRFTRWNGQSARAYAGIFAKLTKKSVADLAAELLNMGTDLLTMQILKRQLDDETDPDFLDSCPVCKTFIKNMFTGGTPHYSISINLKRPVIGIGAPVRYFLSKAVKPLNARAVLPENAEVANALGAIVSKIQIRKQARIAPADQGDFIVEGIAGAQTFKSIGQADKFARSQLKAMIIRQARSSGTSSTDIRFETRDQTPVSVTGKPVFMGRTIVATLTGRPDMVAMEASQE